LVVGGPVRKRRLGKRVVRAGWFGAGRYSRVVDRAFDVTPDARLEIRSSSFDLSLVAGSGTALHVHGTVRGSSRAEIDGVRHDAAVG